MTYTDDLKAAIQSKLELKSNKTTGVRALASADDIKYPTEKAVRTELDKTVVTVEKQTTSESGNVATYYIKQNGVKVGDSINIPLDYLVKSAEVKTCTTPDVPITGLVVGDKYIDFTINAKEGTGTESHIYIAIKDFGGKVYTFVDTDRIDFTEDASGNVSADIKALSVDTGYIKDSAVTTAKLAADSVTTAKIVDANITSAKIGAKEVKTANIDDAAVTTDQLGADAVTNAKLADDAVQTENIKDANVTLAKLAADSVNSSKIVDASIVTGDIAKDTITGGSAANSGNLAADTVHWFNCNDDVEEHVFTSITAVINSLP